MKVIGVDAGILSNTVLQLCLHVRLNVMVILLNGVEVVYYLAFILLVIYFGLRISITLNFNQTYPGKIILGGRKGGRHGKNLVDPS